MKERCSKCPAIAVWMYGPGSDDGLYCEEHVPRGCFCNEDEDGKETLDDQGRRLPCCDYIWCENGIEQFNKIDRIIRWVACWVGIHQWEMDEDDVEWCYWCNKDRVAV